MRSNGKPEVVVITGASAGVGRATARAFGKRRATVALIGRGEDGLKAAQSEIQQMGGRALVFPMDVVQREQLEAAAEQVETECGPIDIWINNAMVSVFSPFMEMSPEEFERVINVTFLGYVWGTRTALKHMLPRNRGVIIQVGSALAYRGIPLQSAYCAAKHAIQGFNDSMRAELHHDRKDIRICMVQLPAVNTPQFDWVRSHLPGQSQPVPPVYQPEVAADAIVFAATHHRREVYVGWPALKAIWANKFFPGLLDWYLGKTGYEAQQTGHPKDPQARDNLYQPLPGDHGAHGRFDAQARECSSQLWLTKHKPWVFAAAGVMLLLGLNQRKLRRLTGLS